MGIKNKVLILVTIVSISLLAFCMIGEAENKFQDKTSGKTLVTYFSATGNTRKTAEEIADSLKSDLFEIIPLKPYTQADLDWENNNSRANLEMFDKLPSPEILKYPEDLSGYDTIWIGYPIWWNQAPKIINTFIENTDLSTKKIIFFATSHGTPIKNSMRVLQNTYPDLNIIEGMLLNSSSLDSY